jgi:nucleoside-diphosphate-sugar epimerase
MKDEKILILGGLGFIGSNLAQKLVKLGADVTIYDACLDTIIYISKILMFLRW